MARGKLPEPLLDHSRPPFHRHRFCSARWRLGCNRENPQEGGARMMSVLEIKEIRKTFGGLKAVDGLSFSIAPGEVVGLLGPNGSGKTTLMNLISGALKPTEGSIRLDGNETGGMRPDLIARSGVAR